MRIIRHSIDIVDHQVVNLPAAGVLLSVAFSRWKPDYTIDLWSLDYELGSPQSWNVFVVGTGNPVPAEAQTDDGDLGRFIGTVVTPSGLVWHVVQGKGFLTGGDA